ncbi:MAG: NfeD family protein [Oscillospiraceae bacterium]|nr:NfeD family protein [Oscillospiraceae bacterium]
MVGYLIFWGVIFVLAVAMEVASMQLVSIWFAIGAVGAFIGALADLGFTGQLGVFVLVSLLLLLVTRPFLAKLRVKQTPPMNADKDIGKQAVVIETVDAAMGTGRVRTNGVDWIAVSETGEILEARTIVTVTHVDGAKLIVRRAPGN